MSSVYLPKQVEEEWRTTPTDLAGWANRAAQMLQEVKRLRGELERIAALGQSPSWEVAHDALN